MRRVLTITLASAFLAPHSGSCRFRFRRVRRRRDPLVEAVAVETLLAAPDDYLGKTVRVDGVITGVCKKRGCWMQVTDPETGNGVRIKVDDGVIVFPYEAMGKKASAEGVFEAIALTPEQVEARAAQQAAEHQHAEGESCDKTDPRREGSAATHRCRTIGSS